jgi:hypothetical protein
MINQIIDTQWNRWGIMNGDIVTSQNFTGIYRVHEIERKETDGVITLVATLYQVFTLDGKPVKLNRPSYCDVNSCKPAFLLAPEVKERIQHLQNLYQFLETLKVQNKL